MAEKEANLNPVIKKLIYFKVIVITGYDLATVNNGHM